MKKFEEVNALNDVGLFHETFGLPVISEPAIPSESRCKLRINLLQEELDELKDAIADNDLVEVADALCDIQYVLSGAIHEFGLGKKFKQLFDEVQRSNMSKTCKTQDAAEKTQKHYNEKDGTQSRIVESGGEFLVYRIPDGKVLKSIDYSPADIKNLI